MKIKRSIQLKAAFLITVFSLNTLVGFACAIGIDMGFNSTHHDDDVMMEVSVHTHADGKKHEHHNEKVKPHHGTENHQKPQGTGKGCCNDKVLKFNEVDKSAVQSLSSGISSVFFTSFIIPFSNSIILFSSYQGSGNKYFLRNYHPPIPDIRVAIQSFQI